MTFVVTIMRWLTAPLNSSPLLVMDSGMLSLMSCCHGQAYSGPPGSSKQALWKKLPKGETPITSQLSSSSS
ncbi:hypothetical protein BDA96_05G007100 [Sorghum bicolor]|uniref:Secreted protein n=2 Tax=Sorghum bicolor TaxID=4558 RepID=A0A921QX26_SORBI|nr:hypothetical protein BDA96_05G007100 [Sorghum bicolor]OQU82699.1 hypothetical protein SORBI_3005G007101 [Sorghum bicolor]